MRKINKKFKNSMVIILIIVLITIFTQSVFAYAQYGNVTINKYKTYKYGNTFSVPESKNYTLHAKCNVGTYNNNYRIKVEVRKIKYSGYYDVVKTKYLYVGSEKTESIYLSKYNKYYIKIETDGYTGSNGYAYIGG